MMILSGKCTQFKKIKRFYGSFDVHLPFVRCCLHIRQTTLFTEMFASSRQCSRRCKGVCTEVWLPCKSRLVMSIVLCKNLVAQVVEYYVRQTQSKGRELSNKREV